MKNQQRIEQGQHLLKMLESVDVNDTDTLDEIDEEFAIFLQKEDCRYEVIKAVVKICGFPQYTRSLDALHDAIPDGWEIFIIQDERGFRAHVNNEDTQFSSGVKPTMHLAWLHAIIQACIWEIENVDI